MSRKTLVWLPSRVSTKSAIWRMLTAWGVKPPGGNLEKLDTFTWHTTTTRVLDVLLLKITLLKTTGDLTFTNGLLGHPLKFGTFWKPGPPNIRPRPLIAPRQAPTSQHSHPCTRSRQSWTKQSRSGPTLPEPLPPSFLCLLSELGILGGTKKAPPWPILAWLENSASRWGAKQAPLLCENLQVPAPFLIGRLAEVRNSCNGSYVLSSEKTQRRSTHVSHSSSKTAFCKNFACWSSWHIRPTTQQKNLNRKNVTKFWLGVCIWNFFLFFSCIAGRVRDIVGQLLEFWWERKLITAEIPWKQENNKTRQTQPNSPNTNNSTTAREIRKTRWNKVRHYAPLSAPH